MKPGGVVIEESYYERTVTKKARGIGDETKDECYGHPVEERDTDFESFVPYKDEFGWDDEVNCTFWADDSDNPDHPDDLCDLESLGVPDVSSPLQTPTSSNDPIADYENPLHNRAVGMRGEAAAARYLERFGYEILERNWKCPAGEADIIARDGESVVFIEVKTRTTIHMGFPAEAVDAEKRSRYEKIAAWYLKDCAVCDVPVRFDVIALMVLGNDRAFMKHYVNAFGAER